MAALARTVYVDPTIHDYVSRLVDATRTAREVRLGVSVRGALALIRAAKTHAAGRGRHYVVPDDVKALAEPVLAHRLILDPEAEFDGVTPSNIIAQVLIETPPPSSEAGRVTFTQTADDDPRGGQAGGPARGRHRARRGAARSPRAAVVAAVGRAPCSGVVHAARLGASSPAPWPRSRSGTAGAGSSSSRSAGAALLVAPASVWLDRTGRRRRSSSRCPSPRVVGGRAGRGAPRRREPRPAADRRRSQLEVPVGDAGRSSACCPACARGGAFDEQFRIPTERRGVIPVGPARTVRADPIGLMRREIVWSQTVELHVHPRTIAIAALSTGFVRDLEGSPTRDLTASDIAFHALREYVPGDDRRFIHWKSSAKTGTFMVRQFEETRRSRLMVLLDLDPGAYADDAEFELAVSAAGVGRRPRDPRRAHRRRSSCPARGRNGAAARVQRRCASCRRCRATGSSTRSASSSATTRAVHAPRCGTRGRRDACRACPSPSWSPAPRAASRRCGPPRRRLPVGVEAVAVQCAPEGEAARARSAGLTVFSIGYLEDLRAMLATIGVGRMSAQADDPAGARAASWPTAISVLMARRRMLAAAMIPWWPVYESGAFVVARGLAIVAGSAVALAGAGSHWPAWSWCSAVFGAYLLLGVPAAVPGRASPASSRPRRASSSSWRCGAVLEAARDDRGAGRLVPGAARAALPARAGRRHRRGDDRAAQPASGRRGLPPAVLLLVGIALGVVHAALAVGAGLAFLITSVGLARPRRDRRTGARSARGRPRRRRRSPTPAACSARRRSSRWRSSGATAASVALPMPPRNVVRAELQPPFEPREQRQPARGLPGGVRARCRATPRCSRCAACPPARASASPRSTPTTASCTRSAAPTARPSPGGSPACRTGSTSRTSSASETRLDVEVARVLRRVGARRRPARAHRVRRGRAPSCSPTASSTTT